jgi:AbiU2
MASHRTPGEMLADYTAAMGSKLGPAFHRLYNDNAWLHMKWNDFLALFVHSPRQMRDLNTAAPGFFRSVQDSWWHDILLHIFRMTDPRRKNVLSVYALVRNSPPALAALLVPHLNAIKTAAAFAHKARHELIAHRNIDVALGLVDADLGSRTEVREAMKTIDDLILTVERHFIPSTPQTDFDLVFGFGGVDQLLDIVERGLKSRDAQFGFFRHPDPPDEP